MNTTAILTDENIIRQDLKRNIIIIDITETDNSIGPPMNRYMWTHKCSKPEKCKVNKLLKRTKTFILEEECNVCYEVKPTGNQICLRCEGSCCTKCWSSVTKCPLCRVDLRPQLIFKRKVDDMI